MKQQCVRRIQFCAGHRVAGHESKCSNLHGHNYVLNVFAEAPSLDSIGRVVDFSVLKECVGGWIDMNWDHGMLLWEKDAQALELMRSAKWLLPTAAVPLMPGLSGEERGVLVNQKLATLPFNPTAENMARYLVEVVCPEVLRGKGVQVVRVEIWETENCMAVHDVRN